MLLFGHLGITLGTAIAAQGTKLCFDRNSKSDKVISPISGKPGTPPGRTRFSLDAVIETLGKNIDIRFLLVGAILPDIIDKPLGLFNIGSGRSISHTLLFLLIFTLCGLILYISRKWKRLLVLAAGILAHLILDSMWQNPHILFWPLYGSQFPTGTPAEWLSHWGAELTGDPIVLIFEVSGFLIIAYFIYFLFKQRKLSAFIKDGYLIN
jgi:inner membrane protein